MKETSSAEPAIQPASLVRSISCAAARRWRFARRRCSRVSGRSAATTPLLKLADPGRPVTQPLAEPLGLGRDHGYVGELDLLPSPRRLLQHQLLDPGHDLLLHGQDLAVDLAPVERLGKRRRAGIAFTIHRLLGIAAPGGGNDVGPRPAGLWRFHGSSVGSAP